MTYYLVFRGEKVFSDTRKMVSGTLYQFPDRRFNPPPFPGDLLIEVRNLSLISFKNDDEIWF